MFREIFNQSESSEAHRTNAEYAGALRENGVNDLGNYVGIIFSRRLDGKRYDGLIFPRECVLQNLQTFVVVLDAVRQGYGSFSQEYRDKIRSILQPLNGDLEALYEASPDEVSEEFLKRYEPVYLDWIKIMHLEHPQADSPVTSEIKDNPCP